MFSIDIIRYICKYLSDIDINSFLSSDTQLYRFKHLIKFKQLHTLTSKIHSLSYYDSFINLKIICSNWNTYLSNEESDDEFYLLKNKKVMPFILPKNLTKIIIPNFDNDILSVIVPQIKFPLKKIYICVSIGTRWHFEAIKDIPVTHLVVKEKEKEKETKYYQNILRSEIPSTVRHLIFDETFNMVLTHNNIPSFITHLFINNPKYGYDLNLPENLIHLKITNVNIEYLHNFPKTLKSLDINFTSCNLNVLKIYPSSITHLRIDGSFYGEIPRGITHLTIGENFRGEHNLVPSSVTHLIFEKNFDLDKVIVKIPKSVKYLTIPKKYYEQLSDRMLSNIKITYC